jgi:hypothetical protein
MKYAELAVATLVFVSEQRYGASVREIAAFFDDWFGVPTDRQRARRFVRMMRDKDYLVAAGSWDQASARYRISDRLRERLNGGRA